MVTAGHVIKDIAAQQTGKPIKARLLDFAGIEPKHPTGIPFDFDPEAWSVFGDETDFDYAVLPIKPYYRDQLGANEIAALDGHATGLS